MDQDLGAIVQAKAAARMATIREIGFFHCTCCAKSLSESRLGSIGVYFPEKRVQTVKGEKYRLVIYPLCDVCARLPAVESGRKCEGNIIRQGALLDPNYYKPPTA
jgi:hypothetical protein